MTGASYVIVIPGPMIGKARAGTRVTWGPADMAGFAPPEPISTAPPKPANISVAERAT